MIARSPAEAAVLEQFAARTSAEVRLPDPADATRLLRFRPPDLVGAAHLRADRSAVQAIDEERVVTSRGTLHAARVVLVVDHDVDHFVPDVADTAGLLRCPLRMREVDPAPGRTAPAHPVPGEPVGVAFTDRPVAVGAR